MISLREWFSKQHRHVTDILFVFAHPDDELLYAGAFIQWAVAHRKVVHVMSLTHGEKGINERYHNEDVLRRVRQREFYSLMRQLGVHRSSVSEFPDGDLFNHLHSVSVAIQSYCQKHKINLIVTHDPRGEYGHPDHITVSAACKIAAERQNIRLLWSHDPIQSGAPVLSENLLKLRLTEKMRDAKMKHLRTYKSQLESVEFTKLMIRLLFIPYEVFSQADTKKRVRFVYQKYRCRAYSFRPPKAYLEV